MSKTKKRAIAIVLAAVLLIGAVVGGTIAYLFDTSATVTNTFTVGDIDITLTEHQIQADKTLNMYQTTQSNSYKFVPGDVLPKDPTITITEDSEPCWLFVKAIESHNTNNGLPEGDKNIIKWGIKTTDEGGIWKDLTTVEGVWYCKVDNPASLGNVQVLTGNNGGSIEVNSAVTKDMKTAITGDNAPQLNFIAAAIQQANVSGTGEEATQAKNAYDELPETFRNWTGA